MTYKYILFDLDGTISASGPGIIKAMQYGLTAAGINETDPATLKLFIGPPLNVQIQKIYGLSEKDILAVIMKFREQYDNKGIFDSAPYEGINGLLSALKQRNMITAVASSKPWPLVHKILKDFSFTSYFDVIVGSNPSDEMKNKADFDQKTRIIKKTFIKLKEIGMTPALDEKFLSSTIMIGDKNYDIFGAKANKITSAGAAWGYGSLDELADAGADFIFKTPHDLQDFLLT